MSNKHKYNSLKKFYPYYLTQHKNPMCRAFHFTGTLLLFVIVISSVLFQQYLLLILLPVIGYGFAWAGHFLFEKNKPAAFNNPLYSLVSDFIMFWHILTGQINQKIREAEEKREL